MINSPIDQIKERLDIVDVIRGYIKVHKAGVNYRAACPFHNEKKGSFFISPTKQIWHCFGACSTGGDMFKFVMMIEGVEFGDALRILAQKAGVELKKQSPEFVKLRTEKQRLYEITNLACNFFQTQLQQSQAGKEAKKYLLDRGMTEESIEKWRIGYSPDVWQGLFNFLTGRDYHQNEIEKVGLALKSNKGKYFDRFKGRIMFPIFDLSSQVVAFGGRIFKQEKRYDGQEEAKYINSPATVLYDKSRTLYGLNKAGIEIRKKDQCLLVEGYMDVITAHEAGYLHVIATSGTALTKDHIALLQRYTDTVAFAFDADAAGNAATARGVDHAFAAGMNVTVIVLPHGKDPDECIRHDRAAWESAIERRRPYLDVLFDQELRPSALRDIHEKKRAAKILLTHIAKLADSVEQSHYVQRLAAELHIHEHALWDALQKHPRAKEKESLSDTPSRPVHSQQSVQETRTHLLLGILIRESSFIPHISTMVTPEMFSQEETRALYKALISFYTQSSFDADSSGDFFTLFRQQYPDLASYGDTLLFSLERGFSHPTSRDILEQEARSNAHFIQRTYTQGRIDEITSELRGAEERGDAHAMEMLAKEFAQLSDALRRIERQEEGA